MTAAAAMTEPQLQEAVRQMCADFGLLYYHAHDSRRSPAGFPDVIAVGPGGMLAAELKSPRGTLSSQQRRWGSYLGRHMRWEMWRPVDLINGIIEDRLREIA